MKDQLVKALALDGRVRIYADRTTDLVQEAQDRFNLYPGATDALGRVLSIASIMGGMLKSDKEMLTININGGGPLGSIIVDAYANGNVRGFVSDPHALPDPEKKQSAVSQIIGTEGTLTVTKDLSMEENWSGTVELQNGEIGQDFAYYFTLSEQTPTAVSVGVKIGRDGKVVSAGCLVLQMMPDATDTDISICEHILSGLKPMSKIIEDYDDASISMFVDDLFDDTQVLSTQDIRFFCPCSREHTKEVIASLAPSEIQKMIDEDHGAEVTCNFCNAIYSFSEEELREILNKDADNLEVSEELEEHVNEDPEHLH